MRALLLIRWARLYAALIRTRERTREGPEQNQRGSRVARSRPDATGLKDEVPSLDDGLESDLDAKDLIGANLIWRNRARRFSASQ